jgi:hypothetical protein
LNANRIGLLVAFVVLIVVAIWAKIPQAFFDGLNGR